MANFTGWKTPIELSSNMGLPNRSVDFADFRTPGPSGTVVGGGHQRPPHNTRDSDQVLAKESDLSLVLDCGLLPALAMVGVAGNCLCAVVFLRQRYRPVAAPLLLALCFSDTGFLLCTLLVRLSCLVGKVDRRTGAMLHVIMAPQVDVLREVMAHVTVLLTLAIGMERCVAVTRPFKLRALCMAARIRTVVLTLYGAALGSLTPAFFQHRVTARTEPDLNVTVYSLRETTFYRHNHAVLDFYLHFLLPLLLRVLPFLGTWVCLVIILVSIRRRLRLRTRPSPPHHHRARVTSSERVDTADNGDLVLEERNITKACMVLLFTYAVCELPGLAVRILVMLRPHLQKNPHDDRVVGIVQDVACLSEVINSAINFFVFLMTSKHFCVTFGKLTAMCRE